MQIQQDIERTPDDVIAARLALLHLLPAELVQLIFDHAEYWATLSSTFAPMQEVRLESAHPEYNTRMLCLLTPKIPHTRTEGAAIRVREVRYEFDSHDQGWGGEVLTGPYEGSYTWFEAVIVRRYEDEDETGGDGRDLQDMLQNPTSYPASLVPSSNLTSTLVRTKHIPPTPSFLWLFSGSPGRRLMLETVAHPHAHDANQEETDVWLVQRNKRAWAETQTHRVVWKADNEAGTGVDAAAEFAHTGAYVGDGAKFVDILRPGDRIAVLARAQFPMWANYIRRANITVVLSV